MAHIASIGAGMFSDLSIANPAATITTAIDSEAEFVALFANEGDAPLAGNFVRVKNIREFPAMGTPPNVVNVPVYGQKSSQQIQGQSDAPSLEITLNYVPAEWAVGSVLGGMAIDGKLRAFRFSLLNVAPTGSGATQYASTSAGLGTVGNSEYYWLGKVEAIQVNPQLTDANTATITFTIQSAFNGPFTIS